MKTFKRGEIYFAKVKYEDTPDFKVRPVLVIGEEKLLVLALKMTTHEPRNYKDYELKYWKECGLPKKTIVRTDKRCFLKPNEILNKIGTINSEDMEEIEKIIEFSKL